MKIRVLVFCLLQAGLLFCNVLQDSACFAAGDSSAAKGPGKHALLIAVADYEKTGLQTLNGTHNDVDLMKQILSDERFGFGGNITVLKDEEAGHTRLKEAFASFNAKIAPGDFVYIHYSGHGSFTPDLNNEEEKYDQTWVSYGSRRDTSKGVDQFDILDDELHSWLLPIFNKAGQVVMVSDSCHSASVTRGESQVVVRAAPKDERHHPLGAEIFQIGDLSKGVIIGAARDVEQAGEFENENGEQYGLFTWYWGKAMEQAKPGETWRDLFKRASVQVTSFRRVQNPQIQGEMADDSVFGGRFTAAEPRIAISQVVDFGGIQRAMIKVGSLAGVTEGSVYRLFSSEDTAGEKLAGFKVDKVDVFYSEGEVVDGALRAGDLLVEESHSFSIAPVAVAVLGDDADGRNKELINRLRDAFAEKASGEGKIPGYVLAGDDSPAGMTLYVLRPKKAAGKYIYNSPEDGLPASFSDQPPQMWVLSDTGVLWHETLKIPLTDFDKGLANLKDNLRKISKTRELKKLESTVMPEFTLGTVIWEKVDSCDPTGEDCLEVPQRGRSLYLAKKGHPQGNDYYTPEEMMDITLEKGQVLTFVLENRSEDTSYYVYILNIGSQSEVHAIYPRKANMAEQAKIKPGGVVDTGDLDNKKFFAALGIAEPGEETVKLIVSEKPVDISLLEQEKFRGLRLKGAGTRGANNPLAQLVANAVHGTTRGFGVFIAPLQWGTLQYSSKVE